MFRATEINRNLLAFNCFLRLNIIINNNYFKEHDFELRSRGTFEGARYRAAPFMRETN